MSKNRLGTPRPVVVKEGGTLPTITAHMKGSAFTGYVNAYVVGENHVQMANGAYRTPLWYLSMVLPKGHGLTGQAIANSLFSNNEKDVNITGVGYIALGNRRQDLQNLGYTIHWNYHEESLGQDAIHIIVESRMLTQFDPHLREATRPRRERSKGGGNAAVSAKEQKETKAKESASMSTNEGAATNKINDDSSESLNAECKPMFLLLVPGPFANDQTYIEQLYLTYLDKRMPFALQQEWAPILWQHAHAKKEIEELEAWSYVYKPRVEEEAFEIKLEGEEATQSQEQGEVQQEVPFQAVIGKAFLCQPDITGVHTAIKDFLVQQTNVEISTQRQEKKEEVAA